MTMLRRGFLTQAAATAVAANCAWSTPALAGVNDPAENKTISLHNPNTGERIRTTFWRDGWFDPRALGEINHFMRDWRQDAVVDFDPYLVGILHNICLECRFAGEVTVLSGYRTKATNDWLRNHPRYSAAPNSMHLYARAVDFTLPAISLSKVKSAARRFQVGGIGYYPSMHFIHVDTGRRRFWRS